MDASRFITTITFPNTVRRVKDYAFESTHLMSAILNEGLETLGIAFTDTGLSKITLPKTLKEIEN